MWEGTGVGDPFIFWVLRFLLIGILFFAGYGISYDKPERFKNYAWTAGVAYSFVEGLRWMRGADYYHYYNDLVTLFGKHGGLYGRGTITKDPEILYDWWVNVFNYSGLPFWVAFVIYSAMLISAVLMILKHFPKAAIWALPLFFIITVNESENLIRQFVAASFLLFAFYFYLEKKQKWMWVMLICVPLFHFSGVIVEALFVFLIYTQKRAAKLYNNKLLLWLSIGIFIFIYFFWELSALESFSKFLNENIKIDDEDKSASYIENADRWFTAEGSISMVVHGKVARTIGIINNTVRFLSYGFIICFGFLQKKHDCRLIVPYFFSCIAIIFKLVGGDIEMFNRFYCWSYLFIPLMLGCILSSKKIPPIIRSLMMVIISIFFIWYVFLSSILGTSMFGYGFIWDADVNTWWR